MLQQPRSQEETPCTRTQDISWETLLKQERKTQPNPLLYSSRERRLTTNNDLAHKRFLSPINTSAQERCGPFPKRSTC
jgi:hypothetical protein